MPGKSGLGSNFNEGLIPTPQIFWTEAPPLDAVSCHTYGRSKLLNLNQLYYP